MPEVLPDTILSRCVPIPLAPDPDQKINSHEVELVDLLRSGAGEKTWSVQYAYRIAQGLQRLLGTIREQIKDENADAMKREEAHYRNSTDGAWLEDREDYYKALTESLYLQRRAGLIEILFVWWSDVLRASTAWNAAICRPRKRKRKLSRSVSGPPRFCAGFGGSKNCATISAATSRKRSPSKLHSWEFSRLSRIC